MVCEFRVLTGSSHRATEKENTVSFVVIYMRGAGLLKIHRNAVRISLPIFVQNIFELRLIRLILK